MPCRRDIPAGAARSDWRRSGRCGGDVERFDGEGCTTCTSVRSPLRCTLNVSTTRPRIVMAAIGTNQLRRTCDDETTNPRPKLDAFGVELQRPEVLHVAPLVVERLLLDILLKVLQRVAERTAGRLLRGCCCGKVSCACARRKRLDIALATISSEARAQIRGRAAAARAFVGRRLPHVQRSCRAQSGNSILRRWRRLRRARPAIEIGGFGAIAAASAPANPAVGWTNTNCGRSRFSRPASARAARSIRHGRTDSSVGRNSATDDHERVDADRQQHAVPPPQAAADRLVVVVTAMEVEMHQ